MSMWLQTRSVRHLVIGAHMDPLCGTPVAMVFDDPPGLGQFVFRDHELSAGRADMTKPLCRRCRHEVSRLIKDAAPTKSRAT